MSSLYLFLNRYFIRVTPLGFDKGVIKFNNDFHFLKYSHFYAK